MQRSIHIEGDPAFGGELHGVAKKVDQNLAETSGIPDKTERKMRGDVGSQIQLLAQGGAPHDIDRFLAEFPDAECPRIQFDSSAFDARVVEHVVDQFEEEMARSQDGFGIILLLVVEGGCFEQ